MTNRMHEVRHLTLEQAEYLQQELRGIDQNPTKDCNVLIFEIDKETVGVTFFTDPKFPGGQAQYPPEFDDFINKTLEKYR
jgi:hypothetical protein